jgi:hypothetical protein
VVARLRMSGGINLLSVCFYDVDRDNIFTSTTQTVVVVVVGGGGGGGYTEE